MTNLVRKSICANQLACANRFDTTGHIQGKEKGMLHSLPRRILAALTELIEGTAPSVKVINVSEELLCSLFCHISQANTLGWHIFKQLIVDQGVGKLTPAYSGCLQMQDGKLLSLLTNEASAPEADLQLIRCNCMSTNVESTRKCSRRCPCKRSNLQHRTVQNTEPIVVWLDIKDDID